MIPVNYTYTNVAAGTANAAGIAAAASQRLMGFCAQESAGSPAVASLNIRHGTANTDTIMFNIGLLASDSKVVWLGPGGVPAQNGVYIDRVAGNTTVTLITAIL